MLRREIWRLQCCSEANCDKELLSMQRQWIRNGFVVFKRAKKIRKKNLQGYRIVVFKLPDYYHYYIEEQSCQEKNGNWKYNRITGK